MPAAKLRETSDSELATVEAIKFRIEKIERDPLVSAAGKTKRIKALRLRLPKSEQPKDQKATDSVQPQPLPAVCAVLLVSKQDLDWGDRKK